MQLENQFILNALYKHKEHVRLNYLSKLYLFGESKNYENIYKIFELSDLIMVIFKKKRNYRNL